MNAQSYQKDAGAQRWRRTRKLSCWFLTLMQLISTTILASLGFSREYYQELSESVVGHASPLFDSHILDRIISEPFGYFAAILGIAFLAKEFAMKSLSQRLLVNVIVLVVLLIGLGFVLPILYIPIG